MLNEIIEALQHFALGQEITEVHHYSFFRENTEYVLKLYDKGPKAGELRFAAIVGEADLNWKRLAPNGSHLLVGNPAATISEAIANLHWFALDSAVKL